MKQLKCLRQTLWRTLLCLAAVVGFASPGFADAFQLNWEDVSGGTSRVDLINDNSSHYGVVTINKERPFKIVANSSIWLSLNDKTYDNTVWNSDELIYCNNGEMKFNNAGTYIICVYDINLNNDNPNVRLNVTSSTKVDYMIRHKLDSSGTESWSDIPLVEKSDKVYSYTGTFFANDQLGIKLTPNNMTTQICWYGNGQTLGTTENISDLTMGGGLITLPELTGEYTIELTLDDNNLPKSIKVTPPPLPDLFIGGSWMNGQSSDLTKKAEQVTQSNGKYVDFVFKTSKTGEYFRFYQKNVADGLGNWMGANNNENDYIFTDADFNGANSFTTIGTDNKYKLPKAGTYTIRVANYDGDRSVKFTVSYVAPEKHLYLGATFKGNLEDPDFRLDNGTAFNKVRFTKYGDDADFMFRFASAFDRDQWIGPSADQDILLSESSKTYSATTSSAKSLQVYKVKNPGVYELEVKSWNEFMVDFTLKYVEEVENSDSYYFVGDLNDWFSTEFEELNGGTSMEKFFDERDSWKFRKVTADEEKPEGVTTDWYVFDNFPDKRLSGQFQISSGGTDIWVNAEVYGHGVSLNSGNMWETVNGVENARLKQYLSQPISYEMIKDNQSLKNNNNGISYRKGAGGSFANFHLECNAVDGARIYFKPGADADMIVSGTPRHYFLFYANNEGDGSDGTVTAKINYGKPNIDNYFLPGVVYDNKPIPNYVDAAGNTAPHMHVGDGVELTKLDYFKTADGKSSEEIKNYLTGLGIDDTDASMIANEGKLPNGRAVSGFNHLYIARIPAGYENPAGWKYTLSLPKALAASDRQKSVTIASNHIYFMPEIDGLCVHLQDESFKSNANNVIVDKDGVKTPVSEYDIVYYYRVYYSKPTEDGQNYQIMIVDHMPGDVVKEEYAAYVSGKDTRKPTLQETGGKLEFGWKPLNAFTSPDEVNATVTDVTKGWDITDGNLTDVVETSKKWHVCWVDSGDRWCRQQIPNEFSNAYIQILAVYYKKDNAYNPRSVQTLMSAPRSTTTIATVEAESVSDALAHADHVSIEPGSLTFNNDVYHHPLQGSNLYYVLNPNSNVWTSVENVEDDLIADEADVNATPVYYNLQGVRVAEPVKGIYIEVRGNVSRKVMF